jgi:ABC-type lipoprotein export system ATPase subunit
VTVAIEVKDVFRVHSTPEGDAAALQGLTLSVREGEVVTVLGPSGSGKTTLLRILGGLDRPSAGIVRVFGTDLARLSPGRLAAYRTEMLGYADQHYALALAPEPTARELVALPLGLRGVSRLERLARADELLDKVGLGHKRRSRPPELSGGKQQRIAVCAALTHRPRLLLADEPTGELDAANAGFVYRAIGELGREAGCTVFLVSHDPESAAIADRVIRIRDPASAASTHAIPPRRTGSSSDAAAGCAYPRSSSPARGSAHTPRPVSPTTGSWSPLRRSPLRRSRMAARPPSGSSGRREPSPSCVPSPSTSD